jgi:hypothetical protein
MAALIRTYEPKLERLAVVRKSSRPIKKLPVHRCVVIAVGLILAGMSFPALMLLGLLTASLSLAFAGFALTITGGAMALIFCGDY